MEHTKRFEIYCKKLYINYQIMWYAAPNSYDNNRYWQHEENKYVAIGFNPKLWELENITYDMHTYKAITILGLTIGYGYSYQDERMI